MTEDAAPGRLIKLYGEYDIGRKEELTAVLSSISNGTPVSIDMSDVTYVDSTFLSALTTMRMRVAELGVTLIGVRPNVGRILQIAQLDRFFVFR